MESPSVRPAEPPPAPAAEPHGADRERPSRRVLFLDDDPRRAEVFLDRCPQAVWITRADACIGRLAEPWDEVHLDHDLNGERFVDVMRDDCGMAVVRWLCCGDREHLREARFFIHSHNFAAASLMVECLLRNGYAAEYRPFGYDLVDFLSFAPPPTRPARVWGRIVALWRRLAGRPRLTEPPATRYDEGGSRGRGPRAGMENGSEAGR